MSFVEWSHDLEVGSNEMDAQHQRLVAIINQYHDAVEKKAPRAELITIFGKVAEYAVYHFRDEEALMEQHKFPALARHRAIHRQLVDRVTEMMAALKQGKPGIEQEIKYFLKTWLTAHIKGIDRQYTPFVAEAATT